MSDQPPIAPYTISDFLQWQGANQLVLQPRFQRGRVWSDKAQSYLIDTIVRKLPIPPIVVRLKVDLKKKKTVREVVDGQQRLTAVFRFIEGDLVIQKVHNAGYAGKAFDDLSEDDQAAVLSYKFPVWTLENLDDAEILEIFARLNTFVVPLNPQERRNAAYFGEFKQSSYGLAKKHLKFWQNGRVFSDMRIARMLDVQFVSMLLMSMRRGIVSTKGGDIDRAYEESDAEFPQREKLEREFSAIISQIGNSVPNLAKSMFRKEVQFYTLFLVLYDARYKLPGGKGPLGFPPNLTQKLSTLSEAIARIMKEGGDTPAEIAFQRAAARATADVGARKARHEFYWKAIFGG